MSGYIKLEKKILNWEWWSDINTFRLFMYLLLVANWTDGTFQGVTIKRGQRATSLDRLSTGTGLSIRQTRTALKHLETTGEVTIKRHAKFSVVTINNYDKYQTSDTVDDKETTGNRQAKRQTNDTQNDNETSTIEEIKNQEYKKDSLEQKANELFEELWEMYPRKKGKDKVSKKSKKELLSIGRKKMVECIENFLNDTKNREEQFLPYGSSFFNTNYKDYLPAEIEPHGQDELQFTEKGYPVGYYEICEQHGAVYDGAVVVLDIVKHPEWFPPKMLEWLKKQYTFVDTG